MSTGVQVQALKLKYKYWSASTSTQAQVQVLQSPLKSISSTLSDVFDHLSISHSIQSDQNHKSDHNIWKTIYVVCIKLGCNQNV